MNNNELTKTIATIGIVASLSLASSQVIAASGMEKCYGVAKAGKNDCGGKHNACAGTSKQDSDQGSWIYIPKGTCGKIVGGTTTGS